MIAPDGKQTEESDRGMTIEVARRRRGNPRLFEACLRWADVPSLQRRDARVEIDPCCRQVPGRRERRPREIEDQQHESDPADQERPPQEPTGHYGPGYGDTTPVDPAADPEDPDTAFARWREARLREMDADYAAWRDTGAGRFPDDFDDWRRAHRRTMSETEKAQLLFERS